MTNFEFYSTNLEALSKRIRRIKSDTNTGTQFFQFQNDEFLERMM